MCGVRGAFAPTVRNTGKGLHYRALTHRRTARRVRGQTQMPAGTIEDCCCSAEQVVTANHHHFRPNLRNLRETRFFQYFKVRGTPPGAAWPATCLPRGPNPRSCRPPAAPQVDMDSECPFWREDFQCSERDCAVLECEPQEVPPSWLAEDARRKLEQGSSAAAAANPFAADCLEETVSGTHSGKRAPSFAVSGETAGSVDEMSALDSFRSTEGVDFQGWNAADAIEPWTSQRKQEEEMTCVGLLPAPIALPRPAALPPCGSGLTRAPRPLPGAATSTSLPTPSATRDTRASASGRPFTGRTASARRRRRTGGPLPASLRAWRSGHFSGSFPASTCVQAPPESRLMRGRTDHLPPPRPYRQSSINTHIAREFKYPSGEWGPNLPLYIERVGKHPYRLQNLYFAFLFVARAVIRVRLWPPGVAVPSRSDASMHTLCDAQAKEAILSFPIDTGDAVEDARTSTLLHNMLNESVGSVHGREVRRRRRSLHSTPRLRQALTECASVVNGFDETSLFRVERGDLGEIEYLSRVQEKRRLRDDFRAKFQNVSRILDCVGCDKCKVWGKVRPRRRPRGPAGHWGEHHRLAHPTIDRTAPSPGPRHRRQNPVCGERALHAGAGPQ